eukprot:gene1075-10594_t
MTFIELQAVVLAGCTGERLYPMNSQIPICMLPVAQKPMLNYPLTWLEKSGFKDVIVVVQKQQMKYLTKYFEDFYKGKLQVQFEQVEDGSDSGDALRSVSHLLKTDFLLMSCDLITTVPLLDFLQIHRKNHSLMTILLTNYVKDTNDKLSIDYFIGFNKQKDIKYFNTSSELKSELKLRKNFIKNCSSLTLTTKYFSPYMFIFTKECLDILVKKEFSSISNEFIPYISNLKNEKKINAFLTENYAKRCYTLNSFQNISKQLTKEEELINFYPTEEKHEYENCNIGADCLVGSNFEYGEENVIKKNSIIGSNCTFGSNVKIVNSIVMSKVVIGDNCTISSSLIGIGSKIKEKTNMTNTIVGPSEEIISGDYKNETICLQQNKFY